MAREHSLDRWIKSAGGESDLALARRALAASVVPELHDLGVRLGWVGSDGCRCEQAAEAVVDVIWSD